MGYGQWWKTLESLIAELRKKQVTIPLEVMASLRSAKTMISVYNADSTYLDSIPAIENYLLQVESTLINIAKEEVGQAFIELWIEKIGDARKEEEPKAETTTTRFFPGHPKDKHWIRVLPSDVILKETVEKLTAELGLSCKAQKDGYMFVYGNKEKVKDFVKKMAEKCRGSRKN